MNQDQVKSILHSLYPEKNGPEFTVIFTGKKSKKVNGLYRPATKEILLHNQNFSNDSALLYTAIHELTHHVLFTTNAVKGRAHSSYFWATFHDFLQKAEAAGLYKRPEKSEQLTQLITEIREKMTQIVRLQEEAGALLRQAHTLCNDEGVRFEDVLDRDIGIQRTTSDLYQRIDMAKLDAEIGPDGAKLCATSRKGEDIAVALQGGETIHQAKQHIGKGISLATAPLDPDEQEERKIEQLRKEAKRLEKTITMLENRLEAVTEELGDIDPDAGACVGFG